MQLIFELLLAVFLIGKKSMKRKNIAENEVIFVILNIQNSKKHLRKINRFLYLIHIGNQKCRRMIDFYFLVFYVVNFDSTHEKLSI